MVDNQLNVGKGWNSISSTIHEVVFEKTANRVVNNVTTKTAVDFTTSQPGTITTPNVIQDLGRFKHSYSTMPAIIEKQTNPILPYGST